MDTAFPVSEPNCAYMFNTASEMCAFCGFGNSVSGILISAVAFSPLVLVPTLKVEDDDWSEVAPTPESATHVSMKLGRLSAGIASL